MSTAVKKGQRFVYRRYYMKRHKRVPPVVESLETLPEGHTYVKVKFPSKARRFVRIDYLESSR